MISNDDGKDKFQITAGWTGNAFALFFFFSPAVIILKLIKRQIEVVTIPYLLLMANIMNCLLWFIYGYRKNDIQVSFCNSIGAVINVIYLAIFWYYFIGKNIPKYLCLDLLTFGLLSGIFYFFMFSVEDFEITGYTAMVFNIFMYAAPGQKLIEVFETSYFSLIPIVSSLIGFFCATSWLIYAIYDHNIQIFVPNALGILFSLVQIATWLHFYNKNQSELLETLPYIKIVDQAD